MPIRREDLIGTIASFMDPPMLITKYAGEGANTGVTFYVQVDDLQAYLDKAESLGGKTIMPPMEIPDMVKLAVFSDPEGNVIGIVN